MATGQDTTQPLTGWGLYPVVQACFRRSEQLEVLSRGAVLARGLGRAYGDAALPAAGVRRVVAGTTLADRILSFDHETGILRAEAGLSLRDIITVFMKRGWFTPVSPGTQHVTLGGMVASDIHGKNHHVDGCFGAHVTGLRLRTGQGEVVDISPTVQPELFWATMGGMGLTGHILEVAVKLKPIASPWIYEESQRYDNLREVFHHLQEASKTWPMTVAWIDTSARGARLGRGIVMAGRWATRDEAPTQPPEPKGSLPFPVTLPSGWMNPKTIALANRAFYLKHPGSRVKHVVHPSSFFHQLDAVDGWNRAYGRAGFTQYQCVMPSDIDAYEELLRRFQQLGGCSFVTVFKDCGAQGQGHLSFPKPGTSVALDIPITRHTPHLVHELNALVLDHGGRVYLAKDAFTSARDFQKMYPRFEEWMETRRAHDPKGRIHSAMSRRLMGD